VRSINLTGLGTGFGGTAKVDSRFQRFQRYFRSFEIDQDSLARPLVRLVPQCANRLFGPISASSCSASPIRGMALMERFLAIFGVARIAVFGLPRIRW